MPADYRNTISIIQGFFRGVCPFSSLMLGDYACRLPNTVSLCPVQDCWLSVLALSPVSNILLLSFMELGQSFSLLLFLSSWCFPYETFPSLSSSTTTTTTATNFSKFPKRIHKIPKHFSSWYSLNLLGHTNPTPQPHTHLMSSHQNLEYSLGNTCTITEII